MAEIDGASFHKAIANPKRSSSECPVQKELAILTWITAIPHEMLLSRYQVHTWTSGNSHKNPDAVTQMLVPVRDIMAHMGYYFTFFEQPVKN